VSAVKGNSAIDRGYYVGIRKRSKGNDKIVRSAERASTCGLRGTDRAAKGGQAGRPKSAELQITTQLTPAAGNDRLGQENQLQDTRERDKESRQRGGEMDGRSGGKIYGE